MSAICLGTPHRAEIVGTTQQLIHDPAACAPEPFSYCGNIAPQPCPDRCHAQLQRIAQVLFDSAEIRGLFGIDFLWDGEHPWVVEINPRYTAACELLELMLERPLLVDHWQCLLGHEAKLSSPATPWRRRGTSRIAGKLILYADRDLEAPDLSRFVRERSPWSIPFLADVPCPRTVFRTGEPLCTVYATGHDSEDVHRKLVRRAARVRRMFTQ